MFWTWDHSTEWVLNVPGAQTYGASNAYTRSPQVFIEDYTRLLRWCGKHHIDAVVVWGLLRAGHGGLDAAQKLCSVAADEGVRLLCGVGLNAYGGVFYEGASPYSLHAHLDRHPECAAVNSAGKPLILRTACPSRKENQQFAAESLRWLFENLKLGGAQIETGDYGVCRCPKCEERREFPVSDGFCHSWEDMALMYTLAAEAIRSVAPDAWIVCETYSSPEPFDGGAGQVPLFGQGKAAWADECIAQFPQGDSVFVQWVCDDYVNPTPKRPWTAAGTVSNAQRRNIMRAHFATYWTGGRRGELAIDWIAEMMKLSTDHGFDAISLFGEVSPFQTGAELNYLAFEQYGSAANPQSDVDVFLKTVAAPLLGGEAHARDYLKYARLAGDPEKIRAALPDIYRRCGVVDPSVARRWVWLANHLASLVADRSE